MAEVETEGRKFAEVNFFSRRVDRKFMPHPSSRVNSSRMSSQMAMTMAIMTSL